MLTTLRYGTRKVKSQLFWSFFFGEWFRFLGRLASLSTIGQRPARACRVALLRRKERERMVLRLRDFRMPSKERQVTKFGHSTGVHGRLYRFAAPTPQDDSPVIYGNKNPLWAWHEGFLPSTRPKKDLLPVLHAPSFEEKIFNSHVLYSW